MSQPTCIDEYTRPVDLNPRTTVLLVIDMQYASGSRHATARRLTPDA